MATSYILEYGGKYVFSEYMFMNLQLYPFTQKMFTALLQSPGIGSVRDKKCVSITFLT